MSFATGDDPSAGVRARRTTSPEVTRAFLTNGRAVEVPASAVEAWRSEVACGSTVLGLADWYQLRSDWHTWQEFQAQRPRHLGESRRARRWHSVQIGALLCATVFMVLGMFVGLGALLDAVIESGTMIAICLGGLVVALLVAAVAQFGRRR